MHWDLDCLSVFVHACDSDSAPGGYVVLSFLFLLLLDFLNVFGFHISIAF